MNTINKLGLEVISNLEDSKRYETAKGLRTVLNHLYRFSGPHLRFENLTKKVLTDFESYLRRMGCCRNTRALYLSRLRSLHVQMVEVKLTSSPGDLYTCVNTCPDEESDKRSVSAQTLRAISDLDLSGKPARLLFARDLFMLSFYLRGIPFVDLAHLYKKDITNNVLRYRRSKTGKLVSILLEPCALEIIQRHFNPNSASPYLFALIKHPNAPDEHRQYESALRLYNKHLKELAAATQLDVSLSSYTPRHSWANLAHEDGIDIPSISQALTHSSEKTTRRYLASFTPDRLAATNRRVIGLLDLKREERKEVNRCTREGCPLFRLPDITGTRFIRKVTI